MKAATPRDPRVDPRLEAALAHLGAGRNTDAIQECEAVLGGDRRHAPALHLLGVALLRLERAGEARQVLEAAAAIAPDAFAIQMTLGDARRASGDVAAAIASYETARGLSPGNGAAVVRLAQLLEGTGQGSRAARLLYERTRDDPLDFEASQALADHLARQVRGRVEALPRAGAAAGDSRIESVSIGMCSIDPARAARARSSLSQALAPLACEFHVVTDARSLSEGFNRILDAARGEVLILCHDDIEVLSSRLDATISVALREADLVGVAGARRVAGPAVLWAGHPDVHGWVTYPRGGEFEAAPLSFESGLLPGMQALDGVFIAMRREALRELRFDASTFDGFHFYDLDFTYRAHLAGLRLAVSTDILLLHASEGQFAREWQHYAQRFLGKYPSLTAPRGEPHWYGARFSSREQVNAFYESIRGLGRVDDAR